MDIYLLGLIAAERLVGSCAVRLPHLLPLDLALAVLTLTLRLALQQSWTQTLVP